MNNIFRVTVWRDACDNWSSTYPGTADGYGRAYSRARYYVGRFGGDLNRFAEVWPDAGSNYPTAIVCGRSPTVTVCVQWLPPATSDDEPQEGDVQ